MARLRFLLAFFLTIILGAAHVYAQEEPRDIIRKSWQLFRQVPNEKERMEVNILYKDGRKEEKALTRWSHYDAAGEDKVTIVFAKPPREEGLGLFIWRHAKGEDDQWLKLPSMKRVRRISIANQSKYFAGTDITYEDARQLIGERINDFEYTLINQTGDLQVIEAVPRSRTSSAYAKRRIWVSEKFAVVKIEYYDAGGLLKSHINTSIRYFDDGSWRVDAAEIDNPQLNRRTTMKVVERQVNTKMPSHVFTKVFLESNGR